MANSSIDRSYIERSDISMVDVDRIESSPIRLGASWWLIQSSYIPSLAAADSSVCNANYTPDGLDASFTLQRSLKTEASNQRKLIPTFLISPQQPMASSLWVWMFDSVSLNSMLVCWHVRTVSMKGLQQSNDTSEHLHELEEVGEDSNKYQNGHLSCCCGLNGRLLSCWREFLDIKGSFKYLLEAGWCFWLKIWNVDILV